LDIFGITDKRVMTFELAVKKLGNKQGFVDLFWPGMIMVEQKSRDKDLDFAFDQALTILPFPRCHPSAVITFQWRF
jgi:hypothetical protein